MKAFFASRKEDMLRFLGNFMEEKGRDLTRVHPLGREAAERILRFTSRGKMLRGGLVFLAYALYAEGDETGLPEFSESVTALGAAMELFQSAFLIHDDIMDRDTRRRGAVSVFAQYAESARAEGLSDSTHLGEAMGICAGDIAFFLAYEILGGIGGAGSLLSFTSQELSYVGVAQMLDVRWGSGADTVAEKEVLDLYRYKTGRYTFSLPLSAGGLMAGIAEDERKRLERIGEHLGIVFQLRDDELGLFGDEEALGKPIGSDVREGKRTPFFLALLAAAEEEEKNRLLGIFGNSDAGVEDIAYVRELMESRGIRERITAVCRELSEEAGQEMKGLTGVRPEAFEILEELLAYGMQRSS
jgi:geranylgeranyl diphosphate synthase, type I